MKKPTRAQRRSYSRAFLGRSVKPSLKSWNHNALTVMEEPGGGIWLNVVFLRLRDRGGRKLWIVSAHAPTETAEDNSKDVFYDELNALMSKIPSQQVVIVGIDANAKMGLEQQSDVLGKWYYPAERTSDNGDRLVDLCEQTGLIIASTFKRNRRRHQLTWQGSTLLTPEEQRKRKMKTLKLQLDYVLARNIP
ncbi:hypothetical protein RB195_023410 [Necator americanus]|uniref:Endonuclease/exonuclease/phosphatase domain-containing protein n=1 Tax=Necator americanus TaxID=51031 RepID=A0ABR1EJ42_NECAM